MNTKNIILGLSLILSSVATLNLTSCQNDDDDDASHAPKTTQVEEKTETTVKFVNSRVSLLVNQGATNTRKNVYAAIETYLKGELGSLAEKVEVNPISVHVIDIVVKSSNETAVTNKLKAMNTNHAALDDVFKADAQVMQVHFKIGKMLGESDMFVYDYVKADTAK